MNYPRKDNTQPRKGSKKIILRAKMKNICAEGVYFPLLRSAKQLTKRIVKNRLVDATSTTKQHYIKYNGDTDKRRNNRKREHAIRWKRTKNITQQRYAATH